MTGFSEPADIIDAFAAALKAKDAERLGDLFSEDAQFVNVRGVLMHGRHGIVQGHKVSFAGPLAGSVFQFDSVDQSLITPDVAVLQAHCLRDRLPDAPPGTGPAVPARLAGRCRGERTGTAHRWSFLTHPVGQAGHRGQAGSCRSLSLVRRMMSL
jgi:uncharacterized protein (TIGR02246 family)